LSLPTQISPAARARRALLFDAAVAGVLAAVALSFAAGLGVIGFFALPLLILGLASMGIERMLKRMRRGRHAR
jgi:hypothetical protein